MLFLIAVVLICHVLSADALKAVNSHKHAHPLHRRMLAHYQDANWLDKVQKDKDMYMTIPIVLGEGETEDGDVRAVVDRKLREQQPDITCVPYAKGRIAKDAFQQHFQHVETIHADRPTDRTCFLLIKNPPKSAEQQQQQQQQEEEEEEEEKKQQERPFEYARLASRLGVTSWHTLDPVLKLDPTALEHISDVKAYDESVKAHFQRRTQQSTGISNIGGTPVEKNNHEYDIEVVLMPKSAKNKHNSGTHPHTQQHREMLQQEAVEDVLQHLHSPVTVDTERALLDTLGKKNAEKESSGGLWTAGHECLDEIHAHAQAHAEAKTRHLQGSMATAPDMAVSSTGINYRKIAQVGPIGFRISSNALHGSRLGRRLAGDSAIKQPMLSRSCHVYLYAKLVQHPDVLSISVMAPIKLMNDVSKSLFQSNTQQAGGLNQATAWPYTAAGLDGTDQVIIVGDTGLDTDHCQFRESVGGTKIAPSDYKSPVVDLTKRKVVQYTYWTHSDTDDEDKGHGTHMASSSCGSSFDGSNAEFDGMAPNAKLSFWDLGTPSGMGTPVDMSILFIPGRAAGAYIFSGSFGSTANMHSQSTYSIDEYVYETNEQTLAIFAAGNEGTEGYYSVGGPAYSKNVLTVGAHESNFNFADVQRSDTEFWRPANQNYVASFSSMGPTYDGRIKPDIMSPGNYVKAASAAGAASCEYHTAMGTSSATALTSGIAALVRQYYMKSAFHQTVTGVTAFTPSGALLKATIIHAGQAMLRYFPNPLQPLYTMENGYETEIPWGTKLGGAYDTGNQDSDKDLPQVGDSNRPDFISGFGRINLQNSLPIPGVANWPFDLHAYDAVSLQSNTEYSWYVQTPASGTWLASPGAEAGEAILKATLVWMDPPLIPFVEKNLAHDLDLIITEVVSKTVDYPEPTATHPIWYGNGEAFTDSLNNVEQISITSLANKGRIGLKLNTYYRVTVRAHILTEATNQKFSLVLTTPKTNTDGSTACVVTPPDYADVAASAVTATGPLSVIEKVCASNELQIEVTMSSHLAIGWQGGSQYRITNSDNVDVHIGHMNSTQTLSQLTMTEVVCLPAGSYTTVLEEVTNTASTVERDRYRSLGQTAVDINDCYVHLQGIFGSKTGQMEIKEVDGKLQCNYCDGTADVQTGKKHFPLAVSMMGSIYGGRLSYGWENGTSYRIQEAKPNGVELVWNTLNQGIVLEHQYCLPEGVYNVGFKTFSVDDDWDTRPSKSSDWVDGKYGIGEYKLKAVGCNGKTLGIIEGYKKTVVNSKVIWVQNDITEFAVDNENADGGYCSQTHSGERFTLLPTTAPTPEPTAYPPTPVPTPLPPTRPPTVPPTRPPTVPPPTVPPSRPPTFPPTRPPTFPPPTVPPTRPPTVPPTRPPTFPPPTVPPTRPPTVPPPTVPPTKAPMPPTVPPTRAPTLYQPTPVPTAHPPTALPTAPFPTSMPSGQPSAPTSTSAPTGEPTQILQVELTFPMKQVFTTSMTANNFMANAAAKLAFRMSVYDQFKTFPTSLADIVVSGATATSSARRLIEDEEVKHANTHRTLAAGISISYSTTIHASSDKPAHVALITNQVGDTMTAAGFTASLTSDLSAVAGVPALTAVQPTPPVWTDVAVVITRSAAPTAGPVSGEVKGGSSFLLIGGIVIGAGVAIGFAVWKNMQNTKERSIQHSVIPTSVVEHFTDVK